jgi:hypothetical protein
MPHNTLEKRRAYDKKYKETHREQLREYEREYRKKYRQTEKGRDIMRKSARDWARKETSKKAHRSWVLKSQYGITADDFGKMLENQNNLCACCGIDFDDTTQGPCIDHDHNTGKVRGLLCASCNWGLGHFEDSILKLESAINYLTRTGE